MRVAPITCLRPLPEHAAEFAALPYDVFTSSEARTYIESHPRSFLAIDRPETGFDPSVDPTSDEVYEHAAKLLRERQLDRTLTIDEKPCFYLYELGTNEHRQMGLMAAIAVDDYLNGSIHKHELTLSAKEEDRVRHIKAVRAQTGPVFLAYRDSAAIDVILDAARMAEPLYDFVTDDGVRQRVWRIAREVAVQAIEVAFTTVPDAYIADGHHRAAAAARICQERRAEGRQDDPAEYFLGVLFPQSQLSIFPYDRIVSDTCGLSEKELLEAIQAAGFTCNVVAGDPLPTAKSTYGMYAFGSWYQLTWNGDTNALDATILQEHVLGPVLHIQDPRNDKRISFAGNATKEELQEFAQDSGVAFALYPVSMQEIMDIADRGDIMPPKSTWFEPKLLSGLAIRRIW